VSGGLRDLGYDTLVVTCHGWQRDPTTKRLRANPKTWPRGYKALVDYAHARGLKVTAYASTGKYNCCPAFEGAMEPGAEKAFWVAIFFIIKNDQLPRQAWDKHRKS
jgi:hypothetical protein